MPVNALWPTLSAISTCDHLSLAKLYYAYTMATLDSLVYFTKQLFEYYKEEIERSEL